MMKYISFARFSKRIGTSGLESDLYSAPYSTVNAIRNAVIKVCQKTPWESKCMVQALTAKRILNSMGFPCTLYMGVMNSPETGEMIAHAWLRCGDKIVTGDGYENYTVTGVFGDNFEPHLTGIRKIKSIIINKKNEGNFLAILIYNMYKKTKRNN
ncbi:MAG: lasso peptide biosynthesis B2 protein [Saccharofermentans sp.]|nr:lasso peptide biosynthesis B2 protein [Saccharofermentans sp.]